jgi:hypothetical protein
MPIIKLSSFSLAIGALFIINVSCDAKMNPFTNVTSRQTAEKNLDAATASTSGNFDSAQAGAGDRDDDLPPQNNSSGAGGAGKGDNKDDSAGAGGGSRRGGGEFRTQTQGGWGAKASGNNPGSYRDQHFKIAFPEGLKMGCDGGFTSLFTTSAAIEAFLPAGSTAGVLKENLTDPVDTPAGVLAGQIVALSLSVGFDRADSNFSASATPLANLVATEGKCKDMSVGDILAMANKVVGGCEGASLSPSEINECVDKVNNSFVDGVKHTGYLK